MWTVVAIALSMPQEVTLFGTEVLLPHWWLWRLVPGLDVLRDPMRLGLTGLVGLSVLTGLAFAEVVVRALGRWGPRPWAQLVAGGLAAGLALSVVDQARDGWGYPPGFVPAVRRRPSYRSRPVELRSPYEDQLRAGHGPLLEVGMAPFVDSRLATFSESNAMLRSTGHWRPLLNGYGSYWPAGYPRSLALAARLPEDRQALHALRDETGLELILVWMDQVPPAKRGAWRALADAGGTAELASIGRDEPKALLFRVE